MTTMWGITSINHFKNLHDYYVKKRHAENSVSERSELIVHAYATPYHNDPADNPAAMWSFVMHQKRDLERIAFKTYIHPQGDFQNGYYDICDIEKGTFDCDNMNLGEVYPVILYAHHETMLTVGCVVKTSDHPDIHGKEQLALWIYYPSGENIESFDMASGHIYK